MTKYVVWASYFENLVTAHVLANLKEEAVEIAKAKAVAINPITQYYKWEAHDFEVITKLLEQPTFGMWFCRPYEWKQNYLLIS